MKKYIAKVVVKSFQGSVVYTTDEEWEIEAVDMTEASKQASERAQKQSWRTIIGNFEEYTVTTIFNSDDASDKLDFVTC